MTHPPQQLILHASAVVFEEKAVILVGASGSGKSSLALQMLALGAQLLADDRLLIERVQATLTGAPAPNLAGLIEARGMGILRADAVFPAPIHLCVDLDKTETQRLPPSRHVEWLGIQIPCLHRVENVAFPAALLQYLRGGRAEV